MVKFPASLNHPDSDQPTEAQNPPPNHKKKQVFGPVDVQHCSTPFQKNPNQLLFRLKFLKIDRSAHSNRLSSSFLEKPKILNRQNHAPTYSLRRRTRCIFEYIRSWLFMHLNHVDRHRWWHIPFNVFRALSANSVPLYVFLIFFQSCLISMTFV